MPKWRTEMNKNSIEWNKQIHWERIKKCLNQKKIITLKGPNKIKDAVVSDIGKLFEITTSLYAMGILTSEEFKPLPNSLNIVIVNRLEKLIKRGKIK